MVDILMATYNSEKYAATQIKSILAQTYQDFNLYIRDDGSTDTTLSILNNYKSKFPDKIFLITDDYNVKNAKLNFFKMLESSKSDYIMFCDHDDVWLENKIELTFNAMKELENQYGNQIPLLVHTDLLVVDNDLNIISNSFFKYQNLNVKNNSLNKLIVQNNVTGCTMMINKALREKVKLEKIEDIQMHDWWFGLIAAAFGKIKILHKPTIKYRQHGDNEVGAKNVNSAKYIADKAKQTNSMKTALLKTYNQA